MPCHIHHHLHIVQHVRYCWMPQVVDFGRFSLAVAAIIQPEKESASEKKKMKIVIVMVMYWSWAQAHTIVIHAPTIDVHRDYKLCTMYEYNVSVECVFVWLCLCVFWFHYYLFILFPFIFSYFRIFLHHPLCHDYVVQFNRKIVWCENVHFDFMMCSNPRTFI